MAAKKKKRSSSGVTFVTISILVILVILFILYVQFEKKRETAPPAAAKEISPPATVKGTESTEGIWHQPQFAVPAIKKGIQGLELVEHSFFFLGYSEEHEQAAWVAYQVSKIHSRNRSERRNNFREDPAVQSGSAHPDDYRHSGYDRGHLAPAGDFDFSKKALSETFFMSNISPQDPSFNRGAWNELENMVRNWASEKDSLWVVTGPILDSGLKKIGQNGVSVPKYFYKIIFDPRQPKISIIGFLMPNEKTMQDPVDFVMPVDRIEEKSGLDFFPLLPDALENRVEEEIPAEEWF